MSIFWLPLYFSFHWWRLVAPVFRLWSVCSWCCFVNCLFVYSFKRSLVFLTDFFLVECTFVCFMFALCNWFDIEVFLMSSEFQPIWRWICYRYLHDWEMKTDWMLSGFERIQFYIKVSWVVFVVGGRGVSLNLSTTLLTGFLAGSVFCHFINICIHAFGAYVCELKHWLMLLYLYIHSYVHALSHTQLHGSINTFILTYVCV